MILSGKVFGLLKLNTITNASYSTISNIMRTPNFANHKLLLLNKKNSTFSRTSSLIKRTYNNSHSYNLLRLQNLYTYHSRKYKSGDDIAPTQEALRSSSTTSNAASKVSSVKRMYSSFASMSTSSKFAKNRYTTLTSNRHNLKWTIITTLSLMVFFVYFVVSLPDDDEDEDEDEKSYKARSSKKIKIFANDWMFFFYSTLPFNAVSRLWGKINSVTLPEWLRPYGYTFYSYMFGANLDEMLNPNLKDYKNLSEFFYRLITPESRPIEESAVIVCPSDGKVLQMGEINPMNGEIKQVKGMTYNVKQFLGTHSHPLMNKSIVEVEDAKPSTDSDEEDKVEAPLLAEDAIEQVGDKSIESTNIPSDSHYKILKDIMTNEKPQSLKDYELQNKKLVFAVIYLAPGDYHHYHSPVDWVVKLRRHFPGQLFSVAPYFQKNFPNLFVLNERVALLGEWKYGFFSMTPVGATNVGSIKLNFDKDLVTNEKRSRASKKQDIKKKNNPSCFEATYSNNNSLINGIPLIKGEEMGGFMLGSTVVLCFEVPKDFTFDINLGEKVKMGQVLGHFKEEPRK